MELYSAATGGRIVLPSYKRLPVPMLLDEATIFVKREEGLDLWKCIEHAPLTYVTDSVITFHRSLAHWLHNIHTGYPVALHDGKPLFEYK